MIISKIGICLYGQCVIRCSMRLNSSDKFEAALRESKVLQRNLINKKHLWSSRANNENFNDSLGHEIDKRRMQ